MTDFIMQNQIAFYYTLIGAAFMGLTFQPAFRNKMLYNIPIIYVLVGIIGALIGLPVINPMGTEIEAKIVEHASELIVIISLAGAGLSIDLKARWKTWQPTWRLLAIAMPLTILCVTWLGPFCWRALLPQQTQYWRDPSLWALPIASKTARGQRSHPRRV